MPLISAKQWSIEDLPVNHHLPNDSMINIIVEYIKHIPLDAYSKGQKSLHQNSKYWGVQIPDSAWKCQRGVQSVHEQLRTSMTLP